MSLACWDTSSPVLYRYWDICSKSVEREGGFICYTSFPSMLHRCLVKGRSKKFGQQVNAMSILAFCPNPSWTLVAEMLWPCCLDILIWPLSQLLKFYACQFSQFQHQFKKMTVHFQPNISLTSENCLFYKLVFSLHFSIVLQDKCNLGYFNIGNISDHVELLLQQQLAPRPKAINPRPLFL